MADPRFPQPEQDASGNGDLPTYDALAAEAGPNSRSVQCPVGQVAENLKFRFAVQVRQVETMGGEAVSICFPLSHIPQKCITSLIGLDQSRRKVHRSHT